MRVLQRRFQGLGRLVGIVADRLIGLARLLDRALGQTAQRLLEPFGIEAKRGLRTRYVFRVHRLLEGVLGLRKLPRRLACGPYLLLHRTLPRHLKTPT